VVLAPVVDSRAVDAARKVRLGSGAAISPEFSMPQRTINAFQ
jgi:hypothetical protein